METTAPAPNSFDATRVWQQALAELQLQMRREDFQTWFHDAELTSFDGATCLVSAENPFTVEWLGSKCQGPVSRALAGVLGSPVEVRFAVRKTDLPTEPAPILQLDSVLPGPHRKRRSIARPAEGDQRPLISPRFTFSNFVVGPSNRLAHAACVAVSEGGATAPNPLFIYGRVGLGKTHLLHAIGHCGVQDGLDVAYVTSESFTNEFVEALSRSRMEAFRARYRKLDLLLIDDIQSLAGKEQTQEEFFHTFNAIVEAGGHLVLTSDRPPRSLVTLTERLQSRFSWGLVADIQEPDLETRLAILRSKVPGRGGPDLPSEVLAVIAERVTGNVRELEGALNRVRAQAEMLGVPVDVDLAKAALESTLPTVGQPAADPDAIIKAVCRSTGVTRRAVEGKSRDKRSAHARHLAMYVLREHTDLSLADIGTLLGDRDHTTVLHGHAKIAAAVQTDAGVRQAVAAVKALLRPN